MMCPDERICWHRHPIRKMGPLSVFSFLVLCLAVFLFAARGSKADSILGTDLAVFSVLGAFTVTNTGAATLAVDLGVFPGLANAVTGGNPFVHADHVS